MEATLTLYGIKFCGFYDSGERHIFGTLGPTMRGLLQWTRSLATIGESSTYASDQDADILRAFCLDIRELGGGKYLLATWNELPSVEEGVQLLQVNSQIGAADISAVEVDALSLPGYPAFFCIDTVRRRIINIRFDQRLNGSRQLQKFLEGYLRTASEWCVWNEEDESELLGYSEDDGDDPNLAPDVSPRFATTLLRTGAQDAYLRDHVNDIRRIIRRATVSPELELHKTFLDSAFKLAGLPVNNRLRADINFQYEFKTRLTPAKLEAVIEEHAVNHNSAWDDVGFTLARDQKTHWLSGAIARSSRQLNLARSAAGMIDTDDLAEYIRQNYEEILASFNEHD